MHFIEFLFPFCIGIRRSKCEEEILQGTDWESVNYSLTKLRCNEDEITGKMSNEMTKILIYKICTYYKVPICLFFPGLCVNDKYLVAQYHIEGGIDVYDRVTLKHLFRLNGHEYGGQCVELSGSILYSASMDFTLKTWNLESQKLLDSVSDHCDYVQCLAIKTGLVY